MHTAICLLEKNQFGKLLFAKDFAKAILCLENNKPCSKCKSCIEFETNNNPDFNIIEPEGNSIKIDQIRELVKKVYEKPVASNKKVYIINNSNLMTKEAENSLLKTLEEPPEYVTIILIASDDNLFLPTIKSRCTKIIFNKLTDEELSDILRKKYSYNNVSEITLKIADGSIKKALDLKGKQELYTRIEEIFNNLEIDDVGASSVFARNEGEKAISLIDLMNLKEQIFKDKEETQEILNYINIIFLEKAKTNNKYIECMKFVEDTKISLSKNYNYDMTIDNFLMTVWEEVNGYNYRS